MPFESTLPLRAAEPVAATSTVTSCPGVRLLISLSGTEKLMMISEMSMILTTGSNMLSCTLSLASTSDT